MDTITIYGFNPSVYVRTLRLVCEEKGMAYKLVPYRPNSTEQREIQPFGKVPALTHGDFYLFESPAIARYLDHIGPDPRLTPQDPREEALMNQWVSITCDYAFDALIRKWVLPERGLRPHDEIAMAEGKATAVTLFGYANAALCNDDFLCGNRLTLADLFLLPQIMEVAAYDEAHEMIEGFDRLASWYAHMLARASVQKVSE